MSASSFDIANCYSYLCCTESGSEVVSSYNSGICQCISPTSSDSQDKSESSVIHLFDLELEQLPEYGTLKRLLSCDGIITARRDAIDWILKVHNYHNFRYETAYLAVNYLDRFLCSRGLLGEKRWHWQLLSVACLSIAAKMEETSPPPLLDLQILNPESIFKPITIQRMELCVMTTLKWRLRLITPFDFLNYFSSKLQCLNTLVHHISSTFSSVSDLILNICRGTDFMSYAPSTIAAAAMLHSIDQDTIDKKRVIFHDRVNIAMVRECTFLFEEHLIDNFFQPACKKQKITPHSIPRSPDGVLDVASQITPDTQHSFSRTLSKTDNEMPSKK